jgi:hypoxanthine phosphoribosyltransferase
MLKIKGSDHLPDILPVRFSGQRARDEERQNDIFPRQLKRDIVGSSLLIFDDNSGTGTTIRKLKDELERYNPRVLDAAVVQVGTTTRVERVLSGEKTNFNRAIIMPEDIAYKGVQVYNLKESMKKAQQFLHHVSLFDYLYRFKLGGIR